MPEFKKLNNPDTAKSEKEKTDMVLRMKRKHPGPGTGEKCTHYSSRQRNPNDTRVRSGRY